MAAMQFWGVEVKAKQPNKVTLDEGHVIHLSQATLGELKKDNEPVLIHVKVGEKKFVLGILNQATPQLSFDLVFDQEFEISHNLKNGSVHFLGYSTEMPEEDDDMDMFGDDSEDEQDALPVLQKENGKPATSGQAEAAKPKAAAKPAKDNKPKPQEKEDSDEDDSDEDDSDEDDFDEDMSMGKSDEDSDDDDEDSDDSDDESEDEKPAKPESGKKRANADAKTPEAKKAKLVTPQKSDGKKGAHTATPHPSKKGSKTPGSEKSTPKSSGQFSCEPCKKTFNSENALQSHSKAKHASK